ncbi:uncharacterized protein LOC115943198 isoform X1 [Leptonychotes weddellii]|uniref:Uncharacterized protein LOC115943198 isoform X1 n=1 Tax=Leptonychotes weddellii TaxID=9713 RepID=A0A7F8RES5_LEPWE|nr:uncharacterized protein LOC115943198 isoform X1 [Leptonychotes weddellii]
MRGRPEAGGSPSPRPALGHLRDRRGAPQRLPEPVSEKMRALQVRPTCLISLSGLSIPGLSTAASVIAAQSADLQGGEFAREWESSASQHTLSRSPASLTNKVPSLQFVRHSERFLRKQIHYFFEILPTPTQHQTPGNAGASFKVPLVAKNRNLAPSSVNAMGLWPPSAELCETQGLERGFPACILKASHCFSSPTLPGGFSITLDMRRRNKLFPQIPARKHPGKGCDWCDSSLILSQTSHHGRAPTLRNYAGPLRQSPRLSGSGARPREQRRRNAR